MEQEELMITKLYTDNTQVCKESMDYSKVNTKAYKAHMERYSPNMEQGELMITQPYKKTMELYKESTVT